VSDLRIKRRDGIEIARVDAATAPPSLLWARTPAVAEDIRRWLAVGFTTFVGAGAQRDVRHVSPRDADFLEQFALHLQRHSLRVETRVPVEVAAPMANTTMARSEVARIRASGAALHMLVLATYASAGRQAQAALEIRASVQRTQPQALRLELQQ
jgi:hypothetical protein